MLSLFFLFKVLHVVFIVKVKNEFRLNSNIYFSSSSSNLQDLKNFQQLYNFQKANGMKIRK
jgi:hypothetical protein